MNRALNFLKEASRFAILYRVGICLGEETYFFPSSDRPSLRFDGVERLSKFFKLSPLELPIVPVAGEYSIYYFDSNGLPVRAPVEKQLLELEPLAIVSAETGDLVKDNA